jgi:hypothetical protein
MNKKLVQFFNSVKTNQDGAIATEYVILLAVLVVSFIWLNKTADTLLFGNDLYARFGDPTQTEEIPGFRADFEQDRLTGDFQGYEADFVEVLQFVGGSQSGEERPDRSHVGRIHVHLSLP